ncbi:solute carrier family 35 member G1 [Haematococcus lacustris]|uniref:Solute carrier family 35 member G1 n=1 Tax=Haematococcus lacustris TaxID=44745 RepID=A0A699ZV08_HAELA|nr:solute carrier family 35 member G1 [Haematococcus lacustris]
MGFGSVTSIYAAVAFLPLGDSTALSFLAPLVVALTSPLLLHETPSRVALLSVPACLAGVLMVAQPSFIFHGTPLPLVGVLIGLTQPIFSAGAKMCVRALRSSEVDTVIIFYMAAISSLCSLFLCLVIPSQHFRAPTSALHWAILVVGVGASGLGNQTCMTVGMRYAPGAFAAISTSYLAMVWAVLLGALFFNERPSVLELCGSGLIIVVTLVRAPA